ncbi:Protein FAR1-RELATED SEQUENCE 5 [Hordeum vulgare]|nr:Protein FAR1-RELATED SEQUENCE 5 [Hordeum vulgare]
MGSERNEIWNLLTADPTGSTTDESNNCKIPLAILKGKQPAEEQEVYRDGYCDNKNVEVEGVQVLGFSGTRETDNNNICEVDRIEGGNNVREVVMDWICSSDGAPAADKQASCRSSVRNELIPGHERDDISSDNDDDPSGDTLDNINIGKATQEEKEMDDMFKGSAFPSIEEVTQAREPEDGLHFKTRDDAFFFFCMKFQLELRNCTYYKCHDLAKGRQCLLKRISSQDKDRKPYPGEEFYRSEFRVDVDELKEIYTCNCKKMSRDGTQCCHVLKVMDQTGMVEHLPKSFIIPRWTRNWSDSLRLLSTSQGDSMTAQEDETMRFGLVYGELSDICSHACRKDKAYNVLLECMQEMKIKVMTALADETDTGKNPCDASLKNPPMVGSKGRKKGDRIKAGSEKNIKRIRPNCSRCNSKGHTKPSCPTNPEVIERNRFQEEKMKAQEEKKARSMKLPTTPTTSSRISRREGECTLIPDQDG